MIFAVRCRIQQFADCDSIVYGMTRIARAGEIRRTQWIVRLCCWRQLQIPARVRNCAVLSGGARHAFKGWERNCGVDEGASRSEYRRPNCFSVKKKNQGTHQSFCCQSLGSMPKLSSMPIGSSGKGARGGVNGAQENSSMMQGIAGA
jgi:hypothetical protein